MCSGLPPGGKPSHLHSIPVLYRTGRRRIRNQASRLVSTWQREWCSSSETRPAAGGAEQQVAVWLWVRQTSLHVCSSEAVVWLGADSAPCCSTVPAASASPGSGYPAEATASRPMGRRAKCTQRGASYRRLGCRTPPHACATLVAGSQTIKRVHERSNMATGKSGPLGRRPASHARGPPAPGRPSPAGGARLLRLVHVGYVLVVLLVPPEVHQVEAGAGGPVGEQGLGEEAQLRRGAGQGNVSQRHSLQGDKRNSPAARCAWKKWAAAAAVLPAQRHSAVRCGGWRSCCPPAAQRSGSPAHQAPRPSAASLAPGSAPDRCGSAAPTEASPVATLLPPLRRRRWRRCCRPLRRPA